MPCYAANPPPPSPLSLLVVLGHRAESLCVPGNELDEIQCVAVLRELTGRTGC